MAGILASLVFLIDNETESLALAKMGELLQGSRSGEKSGGLREIPFLEIQVAEEKIDVRARIPFESFLCYLYKVICRRRHVLRNYCIIHSFAEV